MPGHQIEAGYTTELAIYTLHKDVKFMLYNYWGSPHNVNSRSWIVLALLPVLKNPLQARFSGLYLITKQVNKVNYITHTPDRRKSQRLCHVNMLKKYHKREESTSSIPVAPVTVVGEMGDLIGRDDIISGSIKPKNSDVLANLNEKLRYLSLLE